VASAIVRDNFDPEGRGRLKISFRWQGEDWTAWTRRLLPCAGAERGVYFTPEVGDEVMVSFEGGDLERPVVVGAVHNGQQPSWAEALDEDNDVKYIRTRAGHHLLFRETDGEETLELCTPQARCRIAASNAGEVSITITSEGSVRVLAERGDVDVRAQEGGVQVRADRGPVRVDAATELHLTAGESLYLSAGERIELAAQDISLAASQTLAAQARDLDAQVTGGVTGRSGGAMRVDAGEQMALRSPRIDLNS